MATPLARGAWDSSEKTLRKLRHAVRRSTHAARVVHMGEGTFDALAALAHQSASASSTNPSAIAIDVRLRLLRPVASTSVRLGNVRPDAHSLEVHHRLIAVIALVADDLFKWLRLLDGELRVFDLLGGGDRGFAGSEKSSNDRGELRPTAGAENSGLPASRWRARQSRVPSRCPQSSRLSATGNSGQARGPDVTDTCLRRNFSGAPAVRYGRAGRANASRSRCMRFIPKTGSKTATACFTRISTLAAHGVHCLKGFERCATAATGSRQTVAASPPIRERREGQHDDAAREVANEVWSYDAVWRDLITV